MLIKSHNVRAKTKITENNSSFVKECKCDTTFIYKRYCDFYTHISSINDLYTPKISKIHDENHIEFEYVDLGKSLKEVIESGTYSNDLFYRIGNKLGELHLKINNGTMSDSGYICGDFCTWNIFLKEDDLYFIDFEPPFRILESDTDNEDFLTKNSYIEDIGQFIFRLDNILIPKRPLLFLKAFKTEKKSFFKGYKDSTGIEVPANMLQNKLNEIAKQEVSFERNFQNTVTFQITKVIYKCKYNI